MTRRVVWDLWVHAGIDRERTLRRHQQRIAVRRRFRCDFETDDRPDARTVVDDDRLTPAFGELLGEHTRQHIARSAWNERIDDAYRAIWIIRCAFCGAHER